MAQFYPRDSNSDVTIKYFEREANLTAKEMFMCLDWN